MEYDPTVRQKALAHIEKYGLAPTHKRIISMVKPGSRVLDLGCATGYLANALAQQKCIVTGVEMDAAAAEQSRQYCREVFTGDAGDPKFLATVGHDFDAIICADILEHLIDPWTVLRTLKTLLSPDGSLIVSLPNVAYWKMRLDLLLGRFNYTDTGLLDRTHLRFFTPTTFAETAVDCGYKVIDTIVNDAGFPGFSHPRDWNRLPAVFRKIVTWFPDLCIFHAIYRLNHSDGSTT